MRTCMQILGCCTQEKERLASVKFMHVSCLPGSLLAQMSCVLISDAFSRPGAGLLYSTTHAMRARCERRSTVIFIATEMHSTTALLVPRTAAARLRRARMQAQSHACYIRLARCSRIYGI